MVVITWELCIALKIERSITHWVVISTPAKTYLLLNLRENTVLSSSCITFLNSLSSLSKIFTYLLPSSDIFFDKKTWQYGWLKISLKFKNMPTNSNICPMNFMRLLWLLIGWFSFPVWQRWKKHPGWGGQKGPASKNTGRGAHSTSGTPSASRTSHARCRGPLQPWVK